MKTKLSNFWRKEIRPLLILLLLLFSFRSAIADWNDVPTGSMKPTILEGDRVFVNKVAYDLKVPFTRLRLATWSAPARGDIVVFFSPADEVRLVKRVVGLPGDRIALRENRLFVNGVAADYDLLDAATCNQIPVAEQPQHTFAREALGAHPHPVMGTPALPALRSFDELTVPPGAYFVMGDNRDNSRDSRFIGCVSRDRIVGHATAVVASLDPQAHYRPRADRFFKALP